MKLYVQLQTPTIELPVSAGDKSNATANIKVGFKRYEIEDTQAKLEEYTAIAERQSEQLTAIRDNGGKLSDLDTSEMEEYIKKEVVYIKDCTLVMANDDGSPVKGKKTLVINDTRTAQPVEGFWETGEECLAALLDMFLSSAPWKSPFTDALMDALVNTKTDDKAKN